MPRVIFLDTGPLGLITKRRGVTEADVCRQWAADCLRGGAEIIVPAIAYYEVSRELERAGNVNGLQRLEAFAAAVPDRYLPLTDSALRLAARLWARTRNAGLSTADPKELDCDVLIAAQTLDTGLPIADVMVATGNVGHLLRLVPADLWSNITP